MSSISSSKPVFRQPRGSKAAIIRPVNRRDGKQSFVRIDAAEEAMSPITRAVQLEDYVAQIRETKDAPSAHASPTPEANTIADKIAEQQLVSSTELTHSDHVDVLRAVAKLDGGYRWIAESNRIAAQSASNIGDSLESDNRIGDSLELSLIHI